MSAVKLSSVSVSRDELIGSEPVIVYRGSKYDHSVPLPTAKVVDNKRVFVSQLVLQSLPPVVIVS